MPKRLLALACTFVSLSCAAADVAAPTCSATGTPPLETVEPVTEKPTCKATPDSLYRSGRGLYEHVRWPQKTVLASQLLDFFKEHVLP